LSAGKRRRKNFRKGGERVSGSVIEEKHITQEAPKESGRRMEGGRNQWGPNLLLY